jgi:dihydroxy-acid dehydratase
MTLDIAMGGSTNTILHLLAIAHEAGVDFTMHDIDHLSKKVPNICKVAPSSNYHMEDVNRAGGIMSIMGELARANLLDLSVSRVDFPTLAEAIENYDIRSTSVSAKALDIAASAAASNGRNLSFASQNTKSAYLDTDRERGCIRSVEHAYSQDGGLAVLFGNIARNGCIVKTAGVDEKMHHFTGKAKVYESQDQAMQAILDGKVVDGDVVVIRYEGPKGGPGMQEMLYPTSYLKSARLDKTCALITDGRFSGGTSGLSIGHVSPEAAAHGEIALIYDGDTIEINIPNRSINLLISENEWQNRKMIEDNSNKPYQAKFRNRIVSKALKTYAALVSSADKGAVRIIE